MTAQEGCTDMRDDVGVTGLKKNAEDGRAGYHSNGEVSQFDFSR